MNKVSESIWNNRSYIIPLAEVSFVLKLYCSEYYSNEDGRKKGDPNGIQVFMKHSKYCPDSQELSPSIYLQEEASKSFLECWTFYRHEVEGGSEAFKGPED